MKIVLAWLCIAVAVGMVILLIFSAKDCKSDSNGFFEFLLNWLCDSYDVFTLLFLSVMGALILFVRANK